MYVCACPNYCLFFYFGTSDFFFFSLDAWIHCFSPIHLAPVVASIRGSGVSVRRHGVAEAGKSLVVAESA